MSKREAFELAVRMLVAWNDRRLPDNADVAALMDAFPSSAHLPIDELACKVIDDLRAHVFRRPQKQERLIRTAIKNVVKALAMGASG
jgi:hypothetical protein